MALVERIGVAKTLVTSIKDAANLLNRDGNLLNFLFKKYLLLCTGLSDKPIRFAMHMPYLLTAAVGVA